VLTVIPNGVPVAGHIPASQMTAHAMLKAQPNILYYIRIRVKDTCSNGIHR